MKKFKFEIHGNEYEVSVEEKEENVAEILVNGTPFVVKFERLDKKISAPPLMPTKSPGRVTPIQVPEKKTIAKTMYAPLPGNILKVVAKEGSSVKRGDVLVVVESMKMENNILAEYDGTIQKVYVQAGQAVGQGEALMEFAGTVIETPPASISKPAAAAPQPKPAPVAAGPKAVKSPLPGNILKIAVQTGNKVKRGDVLVVLESMKMENNILAEKEGTVGKIYVQVGQSVVQDDALLNIE